MIGAALTSTLGGLAFDADAPLGRELCGLLYYIIQHYSIV